MKVLTVVGARPQFVKAAVVSRALTRFPGVREVMVHTGQHYDANMSDVFFSELGIPRPDYQLDVRSGGHGEQTGRMLAAIEAVLLEEQPDWVLVYGDTNSTLAGALAAAKLHIPVAHVEAGLRSFNRRMPEEINRVLTDHVAAVHFVPTGTAVGHLAREGIEGETVHVVGDVMYDAALYYGARADEVSAAPQGFGLQPGGYVLATVHRAENTDDPGRLRAIFDALGALAREIPVVLPLHPRTRTALEREGELERVEGELRLLPPLGFLDMVALERAASLIATDSGGVQKEAFFYRVPCVTLRDETEWTELVEMGWNRLAPPIAAERVLNTLRAALLDGPQGGEEQPYGDGHSAERIAGILTGRAQ
jgi:UDP-GlcNAc3NAcA epimerase